MLYFKDKSIDKDNNNIKDNHYNYDDYDSNTTNRGHSNNSSSNVNKPHNGRQTI